MSNAETGQVGDEPSGHRILGQVLISSVALQDAPAILALQRRAYETEALLYNDWSIQPLTQSLESLVKDISSLTVLKATVGDTIVGTVRGSVTDSICQVGRLCVDQSFRSQGIGSKLLEALEHHFPNASTFELFTGSRSEGNIRLYLRHGYAITGTKVQSDTLTFVTMRKSASLLDTKPA